MKAIRFVVRREEEENAQTINMIYDIAEFEEELLFTKGGDLRVAPRKFLSEYFRQIMSGELKGTIEIQGTFG